MHKVWIVFAAVFGLGAVGAGALGAHFFEPSMETGQFQAYQVAVRYVMYHSLALLAVAWLAWIAPTRVALVAGICFSLGVILFAGSISGLTILAWMWLERVTPIGGVLLMVGWVMLAVAGARLPGRVAET